MIYPLSSTLQSLVIPKIPDSTAPGEKKKQHAKILGYFMQRCQSFSLENQPNSIFHNFQILFIRDLWFVS